MSKLAKLTSSSASRSNAGEPPAKRSRNEGPLSNSNDSRYAKSSEEYLRSLYEALGRIWTETHSGIPDHIQKGGNIEVEVRVGMFVNDQRRSTPQLVLADQRVLPITTGLSSGIEFKAGVDECHMNDVKQSLIEHGFEGIEQPVSRLRVNGKGQRWELNKVGKIISSETKKKYVQMDMALLCHEYDIRINAAIEKELDAAVTHTSNGNNIDNVEDWVQERVKHRISYKHKKFPWRVDITDVDIIHNNSNSNSNSKVATGTAGGGSGSQPNDRELEIEIELDSDATSSWLRSSPETLNEYTNRLTHQLGEIINYCINSEIEPGGSADSILDILTRSEYHDQINKINYRLKHDSNQNNFFPNFVGSMPVNLTRKNLGIVTRQSYYCTEKTDGIRYLLYVIPDIIDNNSLIAVLVDRKGTLYRMPGSSVIGKALEYGTVLDGELVYNRTMKKQVFLMFDVLSIGTNSKLQLPFSTRIALIASEVNQLCRKYLEAMPAAVPSTSTDDQQTPAPPTEKGIGIQEPLFLIRKIFRPKNEINEIVSKLRSEDGHRVYYENDRRHHKSDGIIFQPDTSYIMGTCMVLYKWKWLDLRSVDLQGVINTNNELRLFASGPDGTEIDCMLSNTVALAQYDTYRLKADMDEAGLRRPIVEVTYNTIVGTWRYHHLRKDKKEANKIQTVIGVMLELAEQIPVEELEYAFISNTNGTANDFDIQINKMKKKLLDWKRK